MNPEPMWAALYGSAWELEHEGMAWPGYFEALEPVDLQRIRNQHASAVLDAVQEHGHGEPGDRYLTVAELRERGLLPKRDAFTAFWRT